LCHEAEAGAFLEGDVEDFLEADRKRRRLSRRRFRSASYTNDRFDGGIVIRIKS
jgi:hypothetical protein